MARLSATTPHSVSERVDKRASARADRTSDSRYVIDRCSHCIRCAWSLQTLLQLGQAQALQATKVGLLLLNLIDNLRAERAH